MNRLLRILGVISCAYVISSVSAVFAATEPQQIDHNEQIIADCTRTLVSNPTDVNAYLKRGNAFAARNYPAFRSLYDYNRAIDLKPDFVEAYLARGLVREKCRDYSNAIADFTKVIAMEPGNALAYFRRGNVYWDMKEYDNALIDYNQALVMDKAYAEVYLNRGNIHFEIGDNVKALADYSKAIGLNSTYAKAYYNRGNILYLVGKYDYAIADYDKAIEGDAAARSTVEQRKRELLAMNEKKTKHQTLLEFLKSRGGIIISPEYSEYYNNRGLSFYQQGKYYEAIRDFKEALELNCRSSADENLRIALLDQTIETYTKRIENDRQDAEALFNRGNIYYQRGKYNLAIADFTQVVSVLPAFAPAYNNRASCYLSIGEPGKALTDLDQAIALNPKDADYYFNRAGVHYAKGELDEAIDDYTTAISLKPDFALTYNNRHRVYTEKGQYDMAIADLQEAANNGIHNTWKAEGDRPRIKLYLQPQAEDKGIAINTDGIRCEYPNFYYMRGNIMKMQFR